METLSGYVDEKWLSHTAECMRALGLPEWACSEHEKNGTIFLSHEPQFRTIRFECFPSAYEDLTSGWLKMLAEDVFYVCVLSSPFHTQDAYGVYGTTPCNDQWEQELEDYGNGVVQCCHLIGGGVKFNERANNEKTYAQPCRSGLRLIKVFNSIDESGLIPTPV